MIYHVIGLMSGSSLDGLDIAMVRLEEVRGKWNFEILAADCLPYTDQWRNDLKHAPLLPATEFLKLHTRYGRYTADCINTFIANNRLEHQANFIASHGHTVMHEPAEHTTFQIGDGATIAACTCIQVISDLRMADVALGGQGAPIVPIADQLLFSDHQFLLNIGGIANITINRPPYFLAFDVCPANQILNLLAEREGLMMDENGALASAGNLLYDVLDALNGQGYYSQSPPKSLSNDQAVNMIFPSLMATPQSTQDLLHTVVHHIATQVYKAALPYASPDTGTKMLITGGGAFNTCLVAAISKQLAPLGITVTIPPSEVVKYKEALAMALIATLRWRGENNVLQSVTGATRSSCGGAIWQP